MDAQARQPRAAALPPTLDAAELGDYLERHVAASAALDDWIAGAQALALLSAALECGLLAAARSPATPGQLAARSGLEAELVEQLCLALEAHGIFERSGEGYALAADLATLTAADAPLPLPDLLAGVAARLRALDAIAAGRTAYTTLPSEQGLALAAGVGQSSLSPARGSTALGMGRALPEVHERWQAGGRHLEVGCGVGNNLLSIADAHPTLTAVGVEIDAAVAAEARRRASLLGLGDRVEVRQLDAADLTDTAAFDTAQWSQFFFPAPGRGRVLAAIHRALIPGGYLILPLLGEPPDDPSARREPGARSDALHRLLFAGWGVPVRSVAELQAEVEEAGFVVLRAIALPPRGHNLTRGVLLAHRAPS